MSAVGAQPWSQSQHLDDESCYQARGLDAKKKTALVEVERREEERAGWREQMKHVDARRLVVVDECGSNIALTPLYARSRHPGNAPMAACHATAGKIPPCSPPCRSQASEPA